VTGKASIARLAVADCAASLSGARIREWQQPLPDAIHFENAPTWFDHAVGLRPVGHLS
jgi:hypothetical protein